MVTGGEEKMRGGKGKRERIILSSGSKALRMQLRNSSIKQYVFNTHNNIMAPISGSY